ncbi:MAG: ribose-5-phosphate isomerase RpiA [Thermoplasmatota archaeon]
MIDATEMKRRVGVAAADLVEDGTVVGLGTGSTAEHAVRRIGERIRDGLKVRGVPTSETTAALAKSVGVPLVSLAEVDAVDLTIDGADEVDPRFDLIKGLGGALLREKVVASVTRRQVIIVDATKLVKLLGTKAPVPVEVVPFAEATVARQIRKLGAAPQLRLAKNGEPFRTDSGNVIVDARFVHGIDEARRLEADFHAIPGVVETGLFLGLTHDVIVGEPDGSVRHLRRG